MQPVRKIQIIQPIVPHYRVAFFAALARRADIRIRLDASDAVPGQGSLKLATLPADVPLVLHKCFSFLGHRVFWQEGMRLDPELQSGDVLVLNGNPRFLSNFPLIVAARRRGIGIVWWGHGWSSTSTSLAAYVRRKLMQFADVLLLYMDHEIGEFTRLGFSQDRVFAIGNAIDQKAIRQAAEGWNEIRIAEFRRTNGLIGKHLLLFCGRLTNKAHLELAFQALHRLGQHGDYKLAIIGEGDAAKKLRILSDQLGISEHIRWLGSLTEQADIAPWFLAADCFVYPGAIGLSLMHAFGYGVPVVTHGNRARQMPEARALEHLKNGFLFVEGDVCSLTDGIRFVCDDPVQRRLLAQCALRTASGYSIENMTENFVCAASVAVVVAAKGRAHGAPSQADRDRHA